MFGFGEEAKIKKAQKQFSQKFEKSLGVLDKKLSKPKSMFGKKRKVTDVGLEEYIDVIGQNAGSAIVGTTGALIDNAGVVNIGAKVMKTLLIRYHDKITEVQEKLVLGNTDLLSCNIQDIKNIPKSVHDEIRTVRLRIRASFLVMAYYVTQAKYSNLEEFIANNGLENVQERRVRHLANGELKLHTTFRSLAISLELFKQFNQQLLADLQKAKATNDKKLQSRLLLQNSAFVYEVVDIVIDFIKDFELGGVNTIIALHQDILADLDRNETDDKALKNRIDTDGKLSQTEVRVLKDIENRELFRQQCKDKWSTFLETIGQSQLQVDKYRQRINELELIRDNAKGQLGILHILTSMQMINDNLQTIEQLLEIDDLELATISESEFSSLLNIGLSKTQH